MFFRTALQDHKNFPNSILGKHFENEKSLSINLPLMSSLSREQLITVNLYDLKSMSKDNFNHYDEFFSLLLEYSLVEKKDDVLYPTVQAVVNYIKLLKKLKTEWKDDEKNRNGLCIFFMMSLSAIIMVSLALSPLATIPVMILAVLVLGAILARFITHHVKTHRLEREMLRSGGFLESHENLIDNENRDMDFVV